MDDHIHTTSIFVCFSCRSAAQQASLQVVIYPSLLYSHWIYSQSLTYFDDNSSAVNNITLGVGLYLQYTKIHHRISYYCEQPSCDVVLTTAVYKTHTKSLLAKVKTVVNFYELTL